MPFCRLVEEGPWRQANLSPFVMPATGAGVMRALHAVQLSSQGNDSLTSVSAAERRELRAFLLQVCLIYLDKCKTAD